MAQARTAKPKQSDFTGRQRDDLAAKATEEQNERRAQVSMATQATQKEFDDNVHDPRKPDNPVIVDEVVAVGVESEESPSVVIRVNEDIDEMTFGYGNTFTMKAGGKYQVPREVADHLEGLGLVWH